VVGANEVRFGGRLTGRRHKDLSTSVAFRTSGKRPTRLALPRIGNVSEHRLGPNDALETIEELAIVVLVALEVDEKPLLRLGAEDVIAKELVEFTGAEDAILEAPKQQSEKSAGAGPFLLPARAEAEEAHEVPQMRSKCLVIPRLRTHTARLGADSPVRLQMLFDDTRLKFVHQLGENFDGR
jgi:hypothetical protein